MSETRNAELELDNEGWTSIDALLDAQRDVVVSQFSLDRADSALFRLVS